VSATGDRRGAPLGAPLLARPNADEKRAYVAEDLMVGGPRPSPFRRVVTAITALVLAAAGLGVNPRPAAAVHAVPWRFTSVTVNSSISGYAGAEPLKGWVLQCPAGYTPVSGGIVGGDETDQITKLLEYPNPAAGTYHIMARNNATNGTTITLAANCVWLDDVGTITTVTAEFARNGSGRAGGILRCPADTTVLSAGTDWSNFSPNRRIDFSSPITDGTSYGTGWYVAGYSDIAGTLGIELRCVASSLLAGEYATAADSAAAGPAYTGATAICGSGYRILTGGAAPAGTLSPGTNQGRASKSGPLDYRHWPVRGYQPAGVTLRALALCVPASTASVTYTQVPAALSTARSGTLTFTAADTAGEDISVTCRLDSVQRSCSSGNPVSYGPLIDGQHGFAVTVKNQSGFSQTFPFEWTIDATVPVISSHTPAASPSLTGPFTITFSEPVEGVGASSLIVHAESANVGVAGKIARPSPTTATWTPNTRLVPGETYRVSLTSAIHDVAGNPLTTTFYTVRASTTVESTFAALQRFWDLDKATIANGGAYVVSRLTGSQADLSFTVTAGKTVSVYGIRRPDGGYADIYLDGVKAATASFYSATTTRARVYLSAGLSAGGHTISIRPLGTKPTASSGSWVAVDNVNVGSTVRQEGSLTQRFRRTTAASAYGGSYDLVTHQTDGDSTPARFVLALVGTGVKVYATKAPSFGKARVYIDGVFKATIDLRSASTVYKALVYSTTFPLAQHVIRIQAVGTTNAVGSAINVDRITVN
jgi:hypothetical protein